PCTAAIPAAPDVLQKGPGSVTLTATAASAGYTYQWYTADGKTLLSANQTYRTPVLYSTTTYYLAYRYTASGCISARVPVQAIISDPNYVRKYTPRVATTSESLVKTGTALQSFKDFSYFDG